VEDNQSREVRFIKHARGKFEVLKHYGFEINEYEVVKMIRDPKCIDQKNTQYFAIRAINARYALRVFMRREKDYLLVIAFYQ